MTSERSDGGTGSTGLIVVIPAYNAARTVGRAVASASKQSGIAAVVVIDDGSTDDTASAARAAGATVVAQSNSGPAGARNRGLDEAAARGTHALFLDADDELEPGAAEAVLAALARVPDATAVVGAHRQVSSAGTVGRIRSPEPAWLERGIVDPTSAVLGTHHVFCTTGLTLTRTAIEAGIRFDSALRFAEDRDLIYRAAALGPIAVSGAVLVTKHDSPMQLTTSPSQSRRWLADQVRLTGKHAPLDQAGRRPKELGIALGWVLKNTCRVLARAGDRLPADEWQSACTALRERGWRVPTGARKWYAAGIIRRRLSRTENPRPH